MDGEWLTLAETLVPGNYVKQGQQQLVAREKRIEELLYHRKLPKKGWDDATIEYFLSKLSMMDSNNFLENIGVGEREGRVESDLVARRNFRFSHGIGRSGDVAAVQPKAAGSSLVNKLTNSLALDAIKLAGIRSCEACFLLPTATGMALTICLLYFKRLRPKASFVIWPRIDQKTCYKCILTSGLVPVVIEPLIDGDQLATNLDEIQSEIKRIQPENILCIFTTTSCFAPRIPDNVENVAKLCKEFQIPHLVNNAYGLQSSKCCHLLEQAAKFGRVDVFVQSTDKNFMVPVGGAIVAGFDENLVNAVAKSYPGRASASASIDLLITFLSLGKSGYEQFLSERKKCYSYLKEKLSVVAEKHGERVLETSQNQISLAMTLAQFDNNSNQDERLVSQLGSMLFTRCCSGARVVPKGDSQTVEGHKFEGFGSHCNGYPCSYLNAAAAIGMRMEEVDLFAERLDKCLDRLKKDLVKKSS